MRITLVHHAALGDTLLLIPLLRSLRIKFADKNPFITLVTRASFGQLLQTLNHVDAWASADDAVHAAWFGATPQAIPAWANADLLLSAVSNGTDAWAANARRLSPAAIHFFNPRPHTDYRNHVTNCHREQLAALQLAEPPLPLSRANPRGNILIHPGSGGTAKCWPLDHFLALAKTIQASGTTPAFLLGEAERDRWGETVIAQIRAAFPITAEKNLCELARLLAHARLYLGNDSGITHLAAATGIPVIALFGPSNDTHWRPVGPNVTVLQTQGEMNQLKLHKVQEAVFQAIT